MQYSAQRRSFGVEKCSAFLEINCLSRILSDPVVFISLSSPISSSQKSSLWSPGRKTLFRRKERTAYSPFKEKAALIQQNTWKKRYLQINKGKQKRKKHVWLSRRLHIEGRLRGGPRVQRKNKNKNEAKQNKLNTRERRHDICKPIARRIQVCATCGQSPRASDPARARLL